MRIIDVRQTTVPIASQLKNAYIDFSKMDVSVIAVITDVERDGRTVVGYGFNSNGRYAPHGLLRDRFIPRLMEADPMVVQSELALINQAEELIVLADSSKFSGRSSLILCGLDRIATVITDGGIREEDRAMLEKAGVNLIVADAGEQGSIQSVA